MGGSESGDEGNRARLKPINRRQLILRPTDVETLIEEEHPARAIWELVGRLNLSRYHDAIKVVEGEAGRSATDPRLLISLWLYAYSRGVSSAREIERVGTPGTMVLLVRFASGLWTAYKVGTRADGFAAMTFGDPYQKYHRPQRHPERSVHPQID